MLFSYGEAKHTSAWRRKRNTAFTATCFFRFRSWLSTAFHGGQREGQTDGKKDGWMDGGLGRTLLWGGRRLGRRGGGGRWGGGAFQGAQSLAEPRVLGRLDLIHQDSTLVLQLLSDPEERSEVSTGQRGRGGGGGGGMGGRWRAGGDEGGGGEKCVFFSLSDERRRFYFEISLVQQRAFSVGGQTALTLISNNVLFSPL